MIELDPDNARTYLMRSRALEGLGASKEAEADRAKALELDSNVDP